jgi:geranylgeranyl diphosphate synthase type II
MWPEMVEQKRQVDQELKKNISLKSRSKILNEAIEYALSSGGKRLRPLLVLSSAGAFTERNNAQKAALPAALAVEYVHTYSLIHDDLPAMDNDDYRRGRLSTHRRFDEATAILAGDALLADAFFLLTKAPINALLQCQELALAAGRTGLVGGQAEDLAGSKGLTSKDQWLRINQAKTGRLFEACAVLGALSAGADKRAVENARSFGRIFGESFQLKDDLDDNQGLLKVCSKADVGKWLQHNIEKMRAISQLTSNQSALLPLISLTFG